MLYEKRYTYTSNRKTLFKQAESFAGVVVDVKLEVECWLHWANFASDIFNEIMEINDYFI